MWLDEAWVLQWRMTSASYHHVGNSVTGENVWNSILLLDSQAKHQIRSFTPSSWGWINLRLIVSESDCYNDLLVSIQGIHPEINVICHMLSLVAQDNDSPRRLCNDLSCRNACSYSSPVIGRDEVWWNLSKVELPARILGAATVARFILFRECHRWHVLICRSEKYEYKWDASSLFVV